jgi:hypothetical protein
MRRKTIHPAKKPALFPDSPELPLARHVWLM